MNASYEGLLVHVCVCLRLATTRRCLFGSATTLGQHFVSGMKVCIFVWIFVACRVSIGLTGLQVGVCRGFGCEALRR